VSFSAPRTGRRPPPQPALDPEEEAAASRRAQQNERRGRRGGLTSVLTGAGGVGTAPIVGQRTVLG